MNDTAIIHIGYQVMLVAAKLCAPALVTSLVIGLAISLFQSATSIQEFTLSFVPKLVGVALALLLCGHWMLNTMLSFTQELFKQLPSLLS